LPRELADRRGEGELDLGPLARGVDGFFGLDLDAAGACGAHPELGRGQAGVVSPQRVELDQARGLGREDELARAVLDEPLRHRVAALPGHHGPAHPSPDLEAPRLPDDRVARLGPYI
jgi:hypothetical protein